MLEMKLKNSFLIGLMFVVLCSFAHAELAFVVEMSANDGTLSYGNLYVGDAPFDIVSKKPFTLETVGFDGRSLFRTTFDAPRFGMFTLAAPYQKNVQKIIIIDPLGEEVLSIPTVQYADTCKDKICEPHESFESCPADCPSGSRDDYCDGKEDSICDPDCHGKDADCAVAAKPLPAIETQTYTPPAAPIKVDSVQMGTYAPLFVSIGIGVILLAILVVIVFLRKGSHEVHEYVLTCLKRGYSSEQIRMALEGHDEKQIEAAFSWARKQIS